MMPLHSPRSPHLSIYRWHPVMIASIVHRISGVALATFIPLYLFLLYYMSQTPAHFQAMLQLLQQTHITILLWFMGSALGYHLCNGIRFILQDTMVLQSRHMLRYSAQVVLTLSLFMSLLLGVYLW